MPNHEMPDPDWMNTCNVAPGARHRLVPFVKSFENGRGHINSMRCECCGFDATEHMAADKAEREVPLNFKPTRS